MAPKEDFSCEQTLRFLSESSNFPFIFRGAVESRAKLVKYLKEWSSRKDWKYPILYLSAHGSHREISINDPRGVGFDMMDLRTISRVVADHNYNMEGALVHFGTCSTLDIDPAEVQKFFRDSGVTAISGYNRDVSWVESLAFELLYLCSLQRVMAISEENDGGISVELMIEIQERLFDSRKCRGLIDALGFNLFRFDEFCE
ncbi:MAG: hypothetical protein OXU70_03625 [Gammaproteobacteria bacterium]|nr:hypothetical protein [Gammaproteobacteria bacterium]